MGWYGKDLDGKDENGNIRPYHLGTSSLPRYRHFMGEDVCRKKAGDILRACVLPRRPPAASASTPRAKKSMKSAWPVRPAYPSMIPCRRKSLPIRDELGLNQYHFPFED